MNNNVNNDMNNSYQYQNNNGVNQNMYNQNVNNSYQSPSEVNPKKSNTKLIIIIIVCLVFGSVAYFGISIFLSAKGTMNILDKTRSLAFASDARTHIDSVKQLINEDEKKIILGLETTYIKECNEGNYNFKITLSTLIAHNNYPSISSPFGNNYDANNSYVLVDVISCRYNYSIYLTDGIYSIGTSTNPLPENLINGSMVQK